MGQYVHCSTIHLLGNNNYSIVREMVQLGGLTYCINRSPSKTRRIAFGKMVGLTIDLPGPETPKTLPYNLDSAFI